MLFFNKTKATWKAAFKIKNEWKNFFSHKRIIKENKLVIEKYSSDDHCRKYAYMLAKRNNFQGSPDFYWDTAKTILRVICTGLEIENDDSEFKIKSARENYRFERDYLR